MVCFIGASCLDNIKNSLSYREQQNLSARLYCTRRLSFKSANLEPRKEEFKDLNYLLSKGKLKTATANNIVLRHDIVSNSINRHKSNRITPAHIDELKQSWTDSVTDMLWFTLEDTVPRNTSSNCSIGLLTWKLFSQIVSKSADIELRKDPCGKLELHIFYILYHHQKSQTTHIPKEKTNNTGSCQRKARQKSFMLLQKMSCLTSNTDSVKRFTKTQIKMKSRLLWSNEIHSGFNSKTLSTFYLDF